MDDFLIVGTESDAKLSGFNSPFHKGLSIVEGRCIAFPCLIFPICGWLIVLVATACTEMPYTVDVLNVRWAPELPGELANTNSWALSPDFLI